MPDHVQEELRKLHGIEVHNYKIIIEEATSTRIKKPGEHITQRSTTEVLNDSSENVDFVRANAVPGNSLMLMLLCHITQKSVLPRK